MEDIRKHLKEIYADVDNFDEIVFLDVNIKDCVKNIVHENYVLIYVNEEVRKILSEIYRCLDVDSKNDISDRYAIKVKYLLISKSDDESRYEGRYGNRYKSRYLSSRAVSYLNNISTKFNDYYGINLLVINNINGKTWIRFYYPEGKTFEITLNDFKDAITISNYIDAPSVNDLDVKYITEKLFDGGSNYLFRGINDTYYGDDKIQSSNYRNNKDLDFTDLQGHEKAIADKYLFSRHTPNKTYRNALSIMRHLGHDVCFIDFTEDLNVGLYFACKHTDNLFGTGEIFYFDKAFLEQREDISYPVDKDFIVEPIIDNLVKERIYAQKSVFVYAYRGYLSKKEYEGKINRLFIDRSLKEFFLQMSNLDKNTIFPDKLSFFSDPENFKTAYKELIRIKQFIKDGEIRKAEMFLSDIENKYPQNRRVIECRKEIDKLIKEKRRLWTSKTHSLSSRSPIPPKSRSTK